MNGEKMRQTFVQLEKLLLTDPAKYRAEVDRLKLEDPTRLERFIAWVHAKVETVPEEVDRPLTQSEVDEMIDHTAEALGWSRRRVLAEAMLRLRDDALHAKKPFVPFTPSEHVDVRPPMRRYSSIKALVLGDLSAKLPRAARAR